MTARVHRALEQVGLNGFEHRATHHLSHGEKRRACLAGVLACEPEILVLDEPTSDLDPRGRREFKALLRRYPRPNSSPRTTWKWWWKYVREQLCLDRGEVVADGPMLELLER